MTTPALLNPARSGVYHAPAHVAAVRAAVASEAALWLEIDLGRARTKAHVLESFAQAFALPRTFGHNWDALADALQDLSSLPAAAYVVHLRAAGPAARGLGPEWAILLDALTDTAHYWKARGKPFVVLVDDVSGLPPWI